MHSYDNNPLALVSDSSIHGKGLFAKKDIPEGQWIGHYDGPETQTNGLHVLWVDAETNSGADDEIEWIGYDGNNELRFMNHSSSPSGQMDGLDLYALRKITANEEISIDYGEEFCKT